MTRLDWQRLAVACAVGSIGFLADGVAHASSCSPYGLIGQKWDALGGASGALGYCEDNEQPDGAGGRIERFEWGAIDWVGPEPQANACWGNIGEAWLSRYGGPVATGQPFEDENTNVGFVPAGSGAICPFVVNSGVYWGDTTFLVWNPGTHGPACYTNADNVCSIYGSIGNAWWKWVNNWKEYDDFVIGLPVDEAYWIGTHQRQDFWEGYITYNAATGGTCVYTNYGNLVLHDSGGGC
jgi:hypothetical protein